MKSIILELEENLTDQQIDKLIVELKAKKSKSQKRQKPAKLTKEELALVKLAQKTFDCSYILDQWENYGHYNEYENIFEFILGSLNDEPSPGDHLSEELEGLELDLDDNLSEIKATKEDLVSLNKEKIRLEKEINATKQELNKLTKTENNVLDRLKKAAKKK